VDAVLIGASSGLPDLPGIAEKAGILARVKVSVHKACDGSVGVEPGAQPQPVVLTGAWQC
jgi:hypothetical protein